MGHRIVFDDYAALHLGEEPGKGIGGTGAATEVMGRIAFMDVRGGAFSELVDYIAYLRQPRGVVGAIGTGAILKDI